MWDLVFGPRIEPAPPTPTPGVGSVDWTAEEVSCQSLVFEFTPVSVSLVSVWVSFAHLYTHTLPSPT